MEQYTIFEAAQPGKTEGNPFTDYEIFGEFRCDEEIRHVRGFYDGDGIYKVRFMPSFTGEYTYKIYGTFSDHELTGIFSVTPATEKNHGMVRAHGVNLRYQDGTPYFSVGTTCYGWTQQSHKMITNTLESLKQAYFNKIRFCIFPKHYDYNYRDPREFPYEGTPIDNSNINKYTFWQYQPDSPGNSWDFTRFCLPYFQNIDRCIAALCKMGIEADLILMHPYDRWGFSKMPEWADDLYLKYVTARFSAYRNVWWSLANEYDLCRDKTQEHWEHYAQLIGKEDPYHHLCSIHNCMTLYDFSKPWVTHCSIQRQTSSLELDFIPQWRNTWQKPVVIDEMCYEGDIEHDWGNISAEEMNRRMWLTAVLGGHPGHSECYEGENLWWSHGGQLQGESWKRFGFLHEILSSAPTDVRPIPYRKLCTDDGRWQLIYLGEHRPSYKIYNFHDKQYSVKILDTWNATVLHEGIHTGVTKLELPKQEGLAILILEAETLSIPV